MRKSVVVLLCFALFMFGSVSADPENYVVGNAPDVTCEGIEFERGIVESVVDDNQDVSWGVEDDGTCFLDFAFTEPKDVSYIRAIMNSSDGVNFVPNIVLVNSSGDSIDVYTNTVSLSEDNSINIKGDWRNIVSLSFSVSTSGYWEIKELEVWSAFPFVDGCRDADRIMKLYSNATSNNSHVALWNDSDYAYDICYYNVFGSNYSGEDPHDCTVGNTNKVLALYNETNSHASFGLSEDYAVPVCYGDLSCVYDDSEGEGCSNGGEVVARLYGPSNSHIATADYETYPGKICCFNGFVPVPSSSGVYWAYMNGTRAEVADYGDTVKMIVPGDSSNYFEIFEDDSGFAPFTTWFPNDKIRAGLDDALSGEYNGSAWIAEWKITEEDMEDSEEDDYDHFLFLIDGKLSSHLKINEKGNDDPFVINLESPECGTRYDESEGISIVVDAYDNDDSFTGNVTIDDVLVGSFEDEGIDFVYDLGDGVVGDIQVVAQGTNSRGKFSQSVANIMVLDKTGVVYVDGNYIAACILEPADFSVLDRSDVKFDASTTRGVSVDGGVDTDLVPGVYNFSWKWTFMPNDPPLVIDYGRTIEREAFEFVINFPTAGGNWAWLDVGL